MQWDDHRAEGAEENSQTFRPFRAKDFNAIGPDVSRLASIFMPLRGLNRIVRQPIGTGATN